MDLEIPFAFRKERHNECLNVLKNNLKTLSDLKEHLDPVENDKENIFDFNIKFDSPKLEIIQNDLEKQKLSQLENYKNIKDFRNVKVSRNSVYKDLDHPEKQINELISDVTSLLSKIEDRKKNVINNTALIHKSMINMKMHCSQVKKIIQQLTKISGTINFCSENPEEILDEFNKSLIRIRKLNSNMTNFEKEFRRIDNARNLSENAFKKLSENAELVNGLVKDLTMSIPKLKAKFEI